MTTRYPSFQLRTTLALSRKTLHTIPQNSCPSRLPHRTRKHPPAQHLITSVQRTEDGPPPSYHRQPGMRPKQSLGQNFLRDQNIISKIVDTFGKSRDQLCSDARVVEVGPGLGALTDRLLERHPDMFAIEIDQRAVAFLTDRHPHLDVLHADVLETDWSSLAQQNHAPLAVIGNLPYNIVSQILFSMLEAPAGSIGVAVVMMQKEVAQRIVAKTRTKPYGILSVVGQLYSKPSILFSVPNTAFYPKPDVTSAMVQFEFQADPCLDVRNTTLTSSLRRVVRTAFNQRRKVLRNSLRIICEENHIELPEKWASKRAEELAPPDFVKLTEYLFQEKLSKADIVGMDERPVTVWRQLNKDKVQSA